MAHHTQVRHDYATGRYLAICACGWTDTYDDFYDALATTGNHPGPDDLVADATSP